MALSSTSSTTSLSLEGVGFGVPDGGAVASDSTTPSARRMAASNSVSVTGLLRKPRRFKARARSASSFKGPEERISSGVSCR